jgi:hypothetical protein
LKVLLLILGVEGKIFGDFYYVGCNIGMAPPVRTGQFFILLMVINKKPLPSFALEEA